MKDVSIKQLLDVSIALSAERSGDSLLERILTVAMNITECDGGTLYIRDGNSLQFKIMITKSMGIKQGGQYKDITLPPVPLVHSNVCAYAALENKLINIPDVYKSTEFDFSGPRKYDAMTGFKTKSMLVVPMEDNRGNVIGILQLINAQNNYKKVVPFQEDAEMVVKALASQAAISLLNMQYGIHIRELLDSLVKALSTAIYARTPYNVNHTANMAKNADKFIDWLNRHKDKDWKFTEEEKRQFLMSVWLHDVGKLIVPLEVMNKETRLSSGITEVKSRFSILRLMAHVEALECGTDASEELEEIARSRAMVESANHATFVTDEMVSYLEEIAQRTYMDEDGDVKPWLTPEELECLCIRKGTLTQAERNIMEDHVVMTREILNQVKFTEDFANVPKWAGEHHEFLNGMGYPDGKTADELSKQSRLLTILDIFDGLSASDRPYKPAMPIDKSLTILNEMVKEGKLDGDIFALFEESRVWEEKSQ